MLGNSQQEDFYKRFRFEIFGYKSFTQNFSQKFPVTDSRFEIFGQEFFMSDSLSEILHQEFSVRNSRLDMLCQKIQVGYFRLMIDLSSDKYLIKEYLHIHVNPVAIDDVVYLALWIPRIVGKNHDIVWRTLSQESKPRCAIKRRLWVCADLGQPAGRGKT